MSSQGRPYPCISAQVVQLALDQPITGEAASVRSKNVCVTARGTTTELLFIAGANIAPEMFICP